MHSIDCLTARLAFFHPKKKDLCMAVALGVCLRDAHSYVPEMATNSSYMAKSSRLFMAVALGVRLRDVHGCQFQYMAAIFFTVSLMQ